MDKSIKDKLNKKGEHSLEYYMFGNTHEVHIKKISDVYEIGIENCDSEFIYWKQNIPKKTNLYNLIQELDETHVLYDDENDNKYIITKECNDILQKNEKLTNNELNIIVDNICNYELKNPINIFNDNYYVSISISDNNYEIVLTPINNPLKGLIKNNIKREENLLNLLETLDKTHMINENNEIVPIIN